jgi:serine/threonine-protein kinase HipA
MSNQLEVLLSNIPVGIIELQSDAHSPDAIRFTFLESYKALQQRPVLSLSFEDNLNATYSSKMHVPAWFSNLLPEGPMRAMLAQRANVHLEREFFLLRELGEDLPGDVQVRPLGESAPAPLEGFETNSQKIDSAEPLKFSVAGMQFKFSVNKHERGYRFPLRGQGGRWLIKLPNLSFPDAPLNEHLMMEFARSLGLNVAETALIDAREVSDFSSELNRVFPGTQPLTSLLVKRFDRTETSRRVHTEDFLQILGQYPDEKSKYKAGNYLQFGRLIESQMTQDTLIEYTNRIVFNALMGNGDAHLKNFMVMYPDGQNPELAPNFDVLSTIQYKTDQHEFALNFGKNKRYDGFNVEQLKYFATKLQRLDLVSSSLHFAEQLILNWPKFARARHVSREFSENISRHWARIPLASQFLK